MNKAVEDLSVVITKIVMRPFANRRKDEMMECMKAMRDTCLKVGWWHSSHDYLIKSHAGGRNQCLEFVCIPFFCVYVS